MRRIKQVIQVLVVILVIDAAYLFYKYHEYNRQAVPGQRYNWNISKSKASAMIEKYIKKDFVLTVRQANTIINPMSLAHVQSSIRHNPNSTKTVIFLKTHKTGGSTLQNILFRYFILHNLTIALPAYRASFFWPNKFSSKLFVKKQEGVTKYHALLHHAVYNKQEMIKVVHSQPSFITILREPVALFRSAYKYYNMQHYCFNTTVDHIKQSANYNYFRKGVCPSTQTPVRNLQAFDLGMNLADMENEALVRDLIKDIDQTMDLVLITERFEESLVLLRKKFEWSLEDIVYFKHNAQEPKADNVQTSEQTSKADADILEFNLADHLIYTHFNEKLDEQLKQEFTTEQLASELDQLHDLQSMYKQRCVQQLAKANSTFFLSRASRYAMFRPYGYHTLGYVLKREALEDVRCRLMAMPELSLTHYLKATG